MNRPAFSPNGDGHADTLTFYLDSNKKERISKQIVKIFDAKGTLIRDLIKSNYTSQVLWDGRDKHGIIAPEGKYTYHAQYELTSGETPQSQTRHFYVDVTPIQIKFSLVKTIFSPNNDGLNDYLIVDQVKTKSLINDPLDTITLQIVDHQKQAYKTAQWIGGLPKGVKWSGLDDNGNPSSEGSTYRYLLFTEDSAGNRKVYTSDAFRLIRQKNALNLALSETRFTYYEGPWAIRSVSLRPSVVTNSPIKDPLERLEYTLISQSNNQVARFPIHRSSDLSPVAWTGKTVHQERLPDGTYQVEAKATYESGNVSMDKASRLIIDNQPPVVVIRSQPEYFSPDGDGLNERLQIRAEITDNDKVKSSKMSVYRKIFMKQGRLFKQTLANYKAHVSKAFKTWDLGGQTGALIEWNGMDQDDVRLVESANDYMVYVESFDKAGNRTVTGSMVQVDVLVERLKDGRATDHSK